MRINHNISAINAHRQLAVNQSSTSKSLEKLSSGLRINSAGDDAAGLAISEKMRSQIRGLAKAQTNAQDGISMIQTAEGALQQVSDILQRMRELGVQAMNRILSDSEKDAITSEMTQLRQEVDRIAETSKFNNTYLLKGTLGMSPDMAASTAYQTVDGGTYELIDGIRSLDIAAAEKNTEYTISKTTITQTINGVATTYDAYQLTATIDGETVTGTSLIDATATTYSGFVSFTTADNKDMGIKLQLSEFTMASFPGMVIKTSDGGKTNLQIGANSEDAPLEVEIPDLRAKALGIDALNIMDTDNAKETLNKIDNALTMLSSARGDLGAYQNRMEYTIASLAASEENLTAAESRIRDVDMAKEVMNYTKSNILNQTATAMLSQANQQPQNVLQLLQGL
ncbi:MAG: flagellin [Clostridia bacterium]|nr:flagellin [Clostridia bacterium]